jgi:proprotein convertase subtilisin/kexin type 1
LANEKPPRTRLDLNVLPAYRLGVTGRGVRVAVLDDGLEYTHEDLRANYVSPLNLCPCLAQTGCTGVTFAALLKDPEISYDVTDRDDDPIPRYEEPGKF